MTWARDANHASGSHIPRPRRADGGFTGHVLAGYSKVQRGDLVGPWLWNELQAALNLLAAVKSNSSGWGGQSSYKDGGVTGGQKDTWAEAKASAEANWASKTAFWWTSGFGYYETPPSAENWGGGRS